MGQDLDYEVEVATALRAGFDFCSYLPECAREIGECIRECHPVMRQWWLGGEHPSIELTMIQIAMDHEAKTILEVGVQCGGTALPLAIYAKHAGGSYHGLDNQEDSNCHSESFEYLNKMIDRFGCREVVQLETKKGFAEEVLQGPYDFVFIDHAKHRYFGDFRSLVEGEHLAPGALVFFHDVDFFRATGGRLLHLFEPIEEYVKENDLGECYWMRNGFNSIRCPDLGLVVLKGR